MCQDGKLISSTDLEQDSDHMNQQKLPENFIPYMQQSHQCVHIRVIPKWNGCLLNSLNSGKSDKELRTFSYCMHPRTSLKKFATLIFLE